MFGDFLCSILFLTFFLSRMGLFELPFILSHLFSSVFFRKLPWTKQRMRINMLRRRRKMKSLELLKNSFNSLRYKFPFYNYFLILFIQNGGTLLHWGAFKGINDVIPLLLSKGFDPNAVDKVKFHFLCSFHSFLFPQEGVWTLYHLSFIYFLFLINFLFSFW